MPLKEIVGHSDRLDELLIDLVRFGVVVIPAIHLMRWTNTKRVTSSMWVFVDELVQDALKQSGAADHGYKLYVGDGADTYSFLIWDRGEQLSKKDCWWTPIEELKAKKRGRGSLEI